MYIKVRDNYDIADYLYYVVNYDLNLHQIGISTLPRERLQSHARAGFFFVEMLGPLSSKEAMKLERKILRYLGSFDSGLGEIRCVDFDEKSKPNFSGFTETWRGDKYMVQGLEELIADAERGYPIYLP